MQLHQLNPQFKKKGKKRIGRGGKRGTYSGKGVKGQKSRAGRKMQPIMREIIKRFPKLKGYRHVTKAQDNVAVGFDSLEKFQAGEKITPQSLLEKGIIRNIKGKTPQVKILAQGKLTKKLAIEGCQLSAKAKEMVEKAGGSVNLKSKK